MTEVWKDIKNYEGYYKVSNTGKIKALPNIKHNEEKILKLYKNPKGYLMIRLCINGASKMFSVHRIVAQTFIDNPNNYPQVNHINENKLDNRVENLEWCTNKYNCNYGNRTEKMKNTKISLNQFQILKKPVRAFKDGKEIMTFNSASDAARMLGFTTNSIYGCCNKKKGYKTYKGYTWEYVY